MNANECANFVCLFHFGSIFRTQAEFAKLQRAHEEIRKELNETKSQVVVAEYKRETEIHHQDRRAQEEIASLQQLVHGQFFFMKSRFL